MGDRSIVGIVTKDAHYSADDSSMLGPHSASGSKVWAGEFVRNFDVCGKEVSCRIHRSHRHAQ
jgi:hypothetical protein